MPFSVEVQIRQSAIEGKGIFCLQGIKKGEVVWTIFENEKSIPIKNCPNLEKNIVWSRNQVIEMDPVQISRVSQYGYPSAKFDKIIQLNDGGQYTNHSQTPNIKVSNKDSIQTEFCFALRDIDPGQQLTQDYKSFETQNMPWFIELQKQYCLQCWCLKNIYPDV